MFPTFSIVIPVFNEERYLGGLLKDIEAQTLKPLEVIVADSQSTDKTVEVAHAYSESLPLRTTTSELRTPGAARNAGAKLATAEYIVFVDADVRLSPTDLEFLIGATANGIIDFVTPLYATPGHNVIDQLAVKIINFDIQKGVSSRYRTPGIGCLMCVRKSSHETIRGFDASLAKGNDIDYLTRLHDIHITYTLAKDVIVETSNRRLVKDGRFISILNFTPERSWLGKRVVYPLLDKFGKEKKYGIF